MLTCRTWCCARYRSAPTKRALVLILPDLPAQAGGQSALEQAEAAALAVAEAEEAAALATRLMDVANRYEEEAQLAGGVLLDRTPLLSVILLRSPCSDHGYKRKSVLLHLKVKSHTI